MWVDSKLGRSKPSDAIFLNGDDVESRTNKTNAEWIELIRKTKQPLLHKREELYAKIDEINRELETLGVSEFKYYTRMLEETSSERS